MTTYDYYEILQVSPRADVEVIKAAYSRLALKHHPDKNPGDPNAEKTMRLLNEAKETLLDPARRAEYDRRRAAGEATGPAGSGGSSEERPGDGSAGNDGKSERDILLLIDRGGFAARFVAENHGAWNHETWVDFHQWAVRTFGPVSSEGLGRLAEREKQKYWAAGGGFGGGGGAPKPEVKPIRPSTLIAAFLAVVVGLLDMIGELASIGSDEIIVDAATTALAVVSAVLDGFVTRSLARLAIRAGKPELAKSFRCVYTIKICLGVLAILIGSEVLEGQPAGWIVVALVYGAVFLRMLSLHVDVPYSKIFYFLLFCFWLSRLAAPSAAEGARIGVALMIAYGLVMAGALIVVLGSFVLNLLRSFDVFGSDAVLPLIPPGLFLAACPAVFVLVDSESAALRLLEGALALAAFAVGVAYARLLARNGRT